MNPIVYALFSYGLTIVISLAVIGIIVLIDRIMSRPDAEQKQEEKK